VVVLLVWLQALQLLLLRRYAQNVLGPLTSRALPELLLADGSRCSGTAAMLLLRELQAMTSASQEPLSSGELKSLRLCMMCILLGATAAANLWQQLLGCVPHSSTAHVRVAARVKSAAHV
jgi:hypothetical protein